MKASIFSFFLLITSVASANSEPLDVYGLYLTEGRSHVEIKDCGDQTPCGHIVWIDPESLDDGKTPESLRTKNSKKPVLGLRILEGFSKDDDMWKSGSIYNPKADKSYRVSIRKLESGDLEVKPCVGPFCQTQIWKPIQEE